MHITQCEPHFKRHKQTTDNTIQSAYNTQDTTMGVNCTLLAGANSASTVAEASLLSPESNETRGTGGVGVGLGRGHDCTDLRNMHTQEPGP
ncbi:unnamed protein product [Protopolystoma xenopodis]|uniref:Uncharacterized protein n=1 Tax=Protopolystoma xenopodis TaxID=117903 RepID=A0A3S5CJJ2_9PLAT|nr:unnamed protein product [Protopolystoma xenopodis]